MKPVCLLCDQFDTLMGGGCNQGNQIETVFPARVVKFFLFLKGHIRENQAVHADDRCLSNKIFSAFSVGKYHVGVGHEYHRDVGFLPDPLHHSEDPVGGHAACQSPHVGPPG